MATKTKNLAKSYSGIFGNQVVLKNQRGRVVMTIKPPKRVPKPTVKQIEWQRKFQLASCYATEILKDPAILAAYSVKLRRGLTPYNLALKDYLKPPYINRIDASGYHGNPGEKIRVTAHDDIALAEVTVQIVGAKGLVIEQGHCVFCLPTATYDYTATILVSETAGVTLVARARDNPGNVTELSITLTQKPPSTPDLTFPQSTFRRRQS